MKEYMATNKNKEVKDPVLEEIENDDTPLDDKGTPVTPEPEVTVADLLAKDPSELTASDMDFLSLNKDDLTDEQKVAVGLVDGDVLEPKDEEVEEEEPEQKEVPPVKEEETETEEDKEKKYRSQQTEAQIQAERNRVINNKVEEAKNLPEPTEDELRAFVKEDGAEWDELTNFEQSQARRSFKAERKLSLVTEAVQEGKKVDEWAEKVDEFIDSTDGKPEFVQLSGNEAEFKKFAMKESHRGAPIDILLSAFLHNLPAKPKTRGALFNTGGGGERQEAKTGIVDAEKAKSLRESDPREYKRQVKAGKIKLDV